MKSYNDKIATVGVLVALLAIVVSLVTPEIREWIFGKSKVDAFYAINVVALKKESQAIAKVSELKKNGYSCNYLWIPDYASLSGVRLYSVYIGPFYALHDCEVAVEEYRKKQPDAYGVLVSQDSKKVQIYGIGKITGTTQ